MRNFSLGILPVLFLITGCNHMLAEQVVHAPNHDLPAGSRTDLSPQEMQKLYVDQQLRVSVGPHDATISVWICEPTKAQEVFKFNGFGRKIRMDIHRSPATAPTSAPAISLAATRPAIRGTIFILHGIEDDQSLAPYVLYREILVHEGYRVVQVDLRGHGRSTGDWITFGVVESHDMKQVLDALESHGIVTGEVGVVSISYGAAVAIQWAAIDPRVKAIIAIEPFTNLREVARDGVGFVLGFARFFFSKNDIQQAVDQAGQLANFNPNDASPLRAIAQTHAQILLIHSRDDEFIPFQHSQRLHDAAPDHSKLILVDHNSHLDIWLKSLDLIRKETLAWFDAYLKQ